MEVEISFSGLCVFNNVRGTNANLGDPAVIMIRTDDQVPAANSTTTPVSTFESVTSTRVPTHFFSPSVDAVAQSRWGQTRKEVDAQIRRRNRKSKIRKPIAEAPPAPDVHIPHISFNSNEVRVDDASESLFKQVPFAPGFRYMQLNGVEIEIENDPAGQPSVDASYDTILKRDNYWPAATGSYNPDVVPLSAGARPKASAVVAFLRFGSGTISGGIGAPREWKFERPGRDPLIGTFATEGIYSGFPHSGNDIVLNLRSLDTGDILHTVRFSPIDPALPKMKLFIGNNDKDDIDNAVLRAPSTGMGDSDHFKFLNLTAAPSLVASGPIPTVIEPAAAVPDVLGGVSTGPCGPTSSNG